MSHKQPDGDSCKNYFKYGKSFPDNVGEFLGLTHHKRKILTQAFNIKRYIKKSIGIKYRPKQNGL